MIRLTKRSEHSSDVRITLRVGDRNFDVGQVVDGRCYVRNPTDVPPGLAELTISVDDREDTKPVTLLYGIRADSREVHFSKSAVSVPGCDSSGEV